MISQFVSYLSKSNQLSLAEAGGKGANLGELCRIEGVNVPAGFCISTGAFNAVVEQTPLITHLIEKLSLLPTADIGEITELAAEIRKSITEAMIPKQVDEEIEQHLKSFNANEAFAIRSSATAEDLPAASFAGQQDTYLNIKGREAILKHISKCWASLFTDRAIVYRIQNGFDHDSVQLAVIVQKMVFAKAAGIMFTADPVSSNRKILSIDAGFGLGEAMVAGLVNADNYRVQEGIITGKNIPAKKLAVYASETEGTFEEEIKPGHQQAQVLTDRQILQLESIGRKIEQHFGSPQDIEWCVADDEFYIVQSRPITTLYPIPQNQDKENHVYISVGHQQMMTDAMKPLGLSLWQLTAARPMFKAGGRLFVDVTASLTSVAGRETLLKAMDQHEPLLKDALTTVIERDFIKLLKAEPAGVNKAAAAPAVSAQAENDPSMVAGLIKRGEELLAAVKQDINAVSGTGLFDFIMEDLKLMRQSLFSPENMTAIMAGINASTWIREKMQLWLGETNVADALSQSVANNITSEMGLALLDVADAIRPYPEVINYLEDVKHNDFWDGLLKLEGGKEAGEAIHTFLNKYGMRCPGEIDITKTRWSESPKLLLPIILGHVKNFDAGAATKKFEAGLQDALQTERELLARLKELPNGEQKAVETKQMIDQLRGFAGYREYPKYAIINRLWIYKQALLQEAGKLVQAGIVQEKEDLSYLTFEEFREVVQTGRGDQELISNRKKEHSLHQKLNPPRLINSDGEIINGSYKRGDLPAGALMGLPVSAGFIEGRARVILNMEDARLEEGDILVTVFTDPSWTPLFVSIKGLVTEVGGLMTHGAVIAREYGLPAVVGVEGATRLIKDGQRIRLNGTDGYVEIL